MTTQNDFFQRLKFRFQHGAKYAAIHFLVTLIIAVLVGGLVFFLWYPSPYRDMAGGLGLYKLILIVDIVCGPLLTLLLVSPTKTRKAILIDILLVAVIQLSALAYGLNSVRQARPVAMVFEYNRFRLVNAANIDISSKSEIRPAFQKIPLWGVQVVGIKKPASKKEQQANLKEFMLTGKEMGMFPKFWIPYEDVTQDVWDISDPVASLNKLTLSDQKVLHTAIKKAGKSSSNLRFLPIITPLSDNWIAIISQSGDIVGYANVSGW